jgi:hypothetical protein
MIARGTGIAGMLLFALGALARADVGEPAHAELTRLQTSQQFRSAASDHGSIAGQDLERWKFEISNPEPLIFTVDAKNVHAPVVRETYVRITAMDPYSLRAGQSSGRADLRAVLSVRELSDFSRAGALNPISEKPLKVTAYFYRGAFAAYEVLEPRERRSGQNRFEWRSFPLSQLNAVMKAARSCDNGPDCAAWY